MIVGHLQDWSTGLYLPFISLKAKRLSFHCWRNVIWTLYSWKKIAHILQIFPMRLPSKISIPSFILYIIEDGTVIFQKNFSIRLLKMRQLRPLFRLFLFFKHKFYRKICRRQQDSNSDRRSRRQARWPLDHHHDPRNINSLTLLLSPISLFDKILIFHCWDSNRGVIPTLTCLPQQMNLLCKYKFSMGPVRSYGYIICSIFGQLGKTNFAQ